jgi:hypothetical protein
MGHEKFSELPGSGEARGSDCLARRLAGNRHDGVKAREAQEHGRDGSERGSSETGHLSNSLMDDIDNQ